MRTLLVDDDDAVAHTVASLQAGEVVVVPTDTVYGLAAMPGDSSAVHKVYLAKRRPPRLNLPLVCATLDQVRQLGVELSEAALTLAAQWWPGPLTMAFSFSNTEVRPEWLAGREEVAVRIPDHAFLLDLVAQTGVLMVTSANQHGSATPPTARGAAGSLAPHVSLVIDGGLLNATPSTLVNMCARQPVVEREGSISRQAIADALAGQS
jgi:L-threonylcarbamoyladenylate synthase